MSEPNSQHGADHERLSKRSNEYSKPRKSGAFVRPHGNVAPHNAEAHNGASAIENAARSFCPSFQSITDAALSYETSAQAVVFREIRYVEISSVEVESAEESSQTSATNPQKGVVFTSDSEDEIDEENDVTDENDALDEGDAVLPLEEVEAAEILGEESDDDTVSSPRSANMLSSSNEDAYATTTAGTQRHLEFDRLFREWRSTGDPKLRERLILMNRGLVAFVARKFIDRGEMHEDLMQQGLIGLINALDHFDPKLGARFVTFATPTIMGEMHRYLRDKTWALRVPRRLHELNHLVNQRIETLTQQLDRSPTYLEIARSLGVELEEVIEALEMMHAVEPISIDEMASRDDESAPLSEQLGMLDPDLENWNEHASLQIALEKLEPRERRVLEMVYFQGHSQLEVARALNVSQMNISRMQRRALNNLREFMSNESL